MDSSYQMYFWICCIVVCLIIEALTVSLTTIWFVFGAIIAGILSVMKVNIGVQTAVFFIVSILLLYFTRPLAIKYFNKNLKKTNVDSLVGREAIVIEPICNLKQSGKVKIGDIDWLARTKNNDEIVEIGETIQVLRIEGVKLIVQKI